MARKSRKNQAARAKASEVAASMSFSTAIYVRLSIENSGKDDDGDSIENQIGICREYVEARPYLNLYGIYSDNGEKGWKFDRPEFTRLMDDVRSGRVNCIVVKDLSRFGRDYIETGNYLEKIFPFLGVRFISITDNFDSFTCDDAESALMIPLKNMVNDVYAKDISRKIITSFRQRQETGGFLPGNPPYGYVKSKTRQYRYDVDEKVAPYIRMLFEWKAAGVSHAEMARRLKEMGAVTPAMRKIELGIWHAEKYKHTVWGGRTLIDILTNPVYTGALVYGKIPKALYMGIRGHRVPKEEWRILDGMHEPIVSRELFDKVQAIFDENRKTAHERYDANAGNREGVENRFKGKIICADCGKNMRYARGYSKKHKKMYGNYTCGGYIDSHRTKCSLHYIYASDVETAVYTAIQEQLEQAAGMETLMERLKGCDGGKIRMEAFNMKISNLMQEIAKTNTRRQALYENFVSGMLDEPEYQYAKKEYDGRIGKLNRELGEMRKEKDQFESVFSNDNRWLQGIHMADDSAELTDDMIGRLVDVVKIYEDCRVEVVLNYSDDREGLAMLLKEMEADHGNCQIYPAVAGRPGCDEKREQDGEREHSAPEGSDSEIYQVPFSIKSHFDLKDCEVREFYDDGYSGTNFRRPSFERLLEQIKKGGIDCVIVKDFSRFGRDYIELGDYLERIFPFLGVRFISVNDSYDSNDYKGTTGGLDVVLKNIVYDFYSKDLSVKVTTAKRAKMKKGEYIGGHVPYGLLRNPQDKHKLVIDPEAVAVVREIFDGAVAGKKLVNIARELNEKGYETPARYFQRKNPDKRKYKNTSEKDCWNSYAVRRILRQEMYYGAVVQHKREGVGVGWNHSVAIPKEEQIVVEDRHPGIVTKEEFLEAQKVFHKRGATRRVVEKTYPLWRKVKCGTCGRAMPMKSGVVRGMDYRYFYCPHAMSQVGDEGCTKEFAREDELNEVVWDSVKGFLSAVGDMKKKIGKKQAAADKNGASMVKRLADLQKKKTKCEAERFTNMDQFMAGNLDKEVYQKRRGELTKEAERLDGMIADLEARLQEMEIAQDGGTKDLLETVERFSGAKELDQKIVDALIEKVLVYDPGHVEIRWKFSEELVKAVMGN